MSDLENQIKQLIIDSLGLEDIAAADIGSEDALFGDDGLGLDSVDALELGLAVQKTFGFQLDGEKDNLREHFANVKTLAAFVKGRLEESA
ncbi:MAG: phosphopantetheine-binding protein [Neisseria sp.]|nr:phosphopantetheine-binding protein [Neisseria sp.]